MAIFVLAQLIMGIGGSPYFSLLPAYLDENVHPKDLPIYLGVWSLANSLGPGIGMLIGGKLLSIYVDLKQVRYSSLVLLEHHGVKLLQSFRSISMDSSNSNKSHYQH